MGEGKGMGEAMQCFLGIKGPAEALGRSDTQKSRVDTES